MGGPTARRLVRILTCVAARPAIGGVLLFDVAPEEVAALARWLAVVAGDDRAAAVFVAGAHHGEDDLWLRQRIAVRDGQPYLRRGAGPLVQFTAEEPAIVIAVPDLARASLPVLRAAVATLGEPVAHVERDGMSARWRPRAIWLAGCARSDVGALSRHLLDRFPVRIDVAGRLDGLPDPAGCREIARRMSAATPARLTSAAAAEVVRSTGPDVVGARRDLTLARIARLLAGEAGRRTVTAATVRTAADLLGLAPARRGTAGRQAAATPAAEPGVPAGAPRLAPRGEAGRAPATVVAGGPVEDLPAVAAPAAEAPVREPFPEDVAESRREVDPLRLPWQSAPESRRSRGVAIGVQRAHRVADLAIVPTLLEAARYQAVRRAARGSPHGAPLLVSAGDLRSYRRLPEPDRLLVLVLDHTCRRGWNWFPALAPYLRWAYDGRAGLCVVEVGGRDAGDELRARRYVTASLRDPRVNASLERAAGRATPLAHGIHLAAHEIRRRVGRSIGQAWLVVVSDGRGNVPLAASVTGRLDLPVGREGVTDAWHAAREVRRVGHVRVAVLAPPVGPSSRLARDLARALGGDLVPAAGPAR